MKKELVNTPLVCPSCHEKLPFYFAFSSIRKKKICPGCHQYIISSKKSSTNVQRVTGMISFLSGIPLGVLCFYCWLVASQGVLAFSMFCIGIFGVVGSVYIYACSHLEYVTFPQEFFEEN